MTDYLISIQSAVQPLVTVVEQCFRHCSLRFIRIITSNSQAPFDFISACVKGVPLRFSDIVPAFFRTVVVARKQVGAWVFFNVVIVSLT